MKIAVINCSRCYNLAVDKIANYHRARGDEVYSGRWSSLILGEGRFSPTRDVDKFYFSVIFTADIPVLIRQANLAKSWGKLVEIGGPAATFMAQYIAKKTGIYPRRGLDPVFEHVPGEYELTFTSRGCPHHCRFCGVAQVEPEAVEYSDFPLAPMVGDNNILATSWAHQELVVKRLATLGQKIDFNSGFDVGFFHEEHYRLYSQLRLRMWRFAFDTIAVEGEVHRVATLMRKYGLDRHQVMFYCLIGFPGQTPEECLYRLNTIRGLGMNPYPMRFYPLNSLNRRYVAPGWSEKVLQKMTIYYQTPSLWMVDTWENFKPGKNKAIRRSRSTPHPDHLM